MTITELKKLKVGNKVYLFDELDKGCPPKIVYELILTREPTGRLLDVEPFKLRGKVFKSVNADVCYSTEKEAWDEAKKRFSYLCRKCETTGWPISQYKRLLDYAIWKYRQATKSEREEGKLVFWEVARRGEGNSCYHDYESGIVMDENDSQWMVELKDGSTKIIPKSKGYTTRDLCNKVKCLENTIENLRWDL